MNSIFFFNENKGKLFKRKNGRVAYKFEKIHHDYSYQPHYNFTVTTYRLENKNTGRGTWVQDSELMYDWELLPEEDQPEQEFQGEDLEIDSKFPESSDRVLEPDVSYEYREIVLPPRTVLTIRTSS